MKHLSLYELNQLVGEILNYELPDTYWVEAELSDVRTVKGHCYMELIQKDLFGNTPVARASAKCWRNTWLRLLPKFQKATGTVPHAGMKMLLAVKADFHPNYGFSWIVYDIDPTFTIGDMARKRQEILDKLEQAGILTMQRDLPLSPFAQRIAVISSSQAAGYGDFCKQLEACSSASNPQNHGAPLVFYHQLFPSPMQGEQVEAGIMAALDRIFEQGDHFDVVVIIRGGGATADLSGFDTLGLAEYVANYPLPIITGIGHDRDESVLDIVAHAHVKTPTAAADYLVENLRQTAQRVEKASTEAAAIVNEMVRQQREKMKTITHRLAMAYPTYKMRHLQRLQQMEQKIRTSSANKILREQHRLQLAQKALIPAAQQMVERQRHRLQLIDQQLLTLDPKRMLERGYSLTTLNGKAVKDAAKLKPGDTIVTHLAQGSLTSVVETVTKKSSKKS